MAKLTPAPCLIISVMISVACQFNHRQSFPDHSLVASTYIQKGLPAYDRGWTGEDYRQAGVVLRGLAATDATQLPRHDSPTSGAIFARIVSRENFRRFGADGERLEATSAILRNFSQVGLIYTSATTSERIFDSELVELARYKIDVYHELIQLWSKYKMIESSDAPLPPNSLDDETESRGKMRKGLAGIFDESLTLLANRGIQSADRIRLAETLETTLPAVISYLPSATQRQIPVRIQQMTEQEADAEVKERLARIVGALKKVRPR